MSDFGLDDHKWLKEMFNDKEYWIPAYHRDLLMANVLRTTQRSESANSFYKRFENKYGTLVEFWMRFETAMDQQRHAQKSLDNECQHALPKTITKISLESHGAEVYTLKVFTDFQQEVDKSVLACGVCGFTKIGDVEISTIRDATTEKKYEVQFNVATKDATCSCKLFERKGLICSHIIFVYSGNQVKFIPDKYIVQRWTKNAMKKPIYDCDGNILEDYNTTDYKKIQLSNVWSEIYATIGVVATKNVDDMKRLENILKEFRMNLAPTEETISKKKEIERLFGCTAPTEVSILPPKKSNNKGSGSGSAKRLISSKAKAIEKANKPKRMCKKCKRLGHHDSRNCPYTNAVEEDGELQLDADTDAESSSSEDEDVLVPTSVDAQVGRRITRSIQRSKP